MRATMLPGALLSSSVRKNHAIAVKACSFSKSPSSPRSMLVPSPTCTAGPVLPSAFHAICSGSFAVCS